MLPGANAWWAGIGWAVSRTRGRSRFAFLATGHILAFVLWQMLASASAQPLTVEDFNLIGEGFRVFTEETFGGNGRTCATCHLPDQNYNISPADLPHLSKKQRDLVFASNTPGLENAELVRKLTLFNIGPGNADDEFPEGPFRTSMTMAGLDLTVRNVNDSFPGPVGPQLGWSGDGSPRDGFHHNNPDPNADGSFRSFTNGAIGQHFPKSLNRVEGVDFRFATNDELDAVEAFLKWLGRRPVNPPPANPDVPINREFNFTPGDTITNPNPPPPATVPAPVMTFNDARVQEGRDIFLSNKASCSGCHRNGGAHFRLGRNLASTANPGTNFNSHTDVDKERVRLSLLTGVNIPEDEGGFDTPANIDDATIGAFNIQSLIEAPRKKSFFHNGAEVEFEKAIAFYFREPFLSSPERAGASGLPNHCLDIACLETAFGPEPLERLGAFLRSLSAFYSLRDCERLVQETIDRINVGASPDLAVMHCQFNLEDVRKVLKGAKLSPRPYFDNVGQKIPSMKDQLKDAARVVNKNKQLQQLQKFLESLQALRLAIASIPELP